jgi:serine/arginine repetitive matrix protein 2
VTPPVVEADPRASGHLSVIGEYSHSGNEDEQTVVSHRSQLRVQSESSSHQPVSADWSRVSYMTTGTDGSRISGLSDFPAPPVSAPPAHMSILTSYFGNDDPPPQAQNPPAPTADHTSQRRMTFGGNVDTEKNINLPSADE